MKKTVSFILTLRGAFASFGTVISNANFGSGLETLSKKSTLIKTALQGQKVIFSDVDFKQGLGITDFKKIKITELPDSSDGTLMLAGRRISEGCEIKRRNIGALVFIPASRDVCEAEFKFTLDDAAGGENISYLIKFTDKVNYEPEVKEEYLDSISITTQREIGVYGKLEATDPEGDEIEFIIVSYPKAGTLTLIDSKSGEYCYTPPTSYVGSDSFTYVARDVWGNYSVANKISVSVTERSCETEYTDMQDREEYNAAVLMTALGIMNGKYMGSGNYFEPDEKVSRVEFVTAAMKALSIAPDTSLTQTYFDDNDKIPAPYVSYIATAQRMGAVIGKFTGKELVFSPNEAITEYEAAMILASLSDADTSLDASAQEAINDIPVFARGSYNAMLNLGVIKNSENRNNTVTRANLAEYLYRILA